MPEISTASEKKIKLVVNRIHNLPTPPIVFAQVNKVINDPNTSAYQIGSIVAEDPALSAKILKLTNSAFYGLSRTITSVKQAIVILGLDVVRSLVLSASVFDAFSKQYKIDKDYLDAFWRHSLSVAFMARIISRTKSFPSFLEAEESFSAGLLHDIGKLVIFAQMPDDCKKVAKALLDNPNLPGNMIEEEILGFDHAAVGSYLSQKWNLPESLAVAINHHHNPDAVPDNITTHIINVSDFISWTAAKMSDETELYVEHVPLCQLSWDKLGLKIEQEGQLVQLLQTEYTKAETFLKMAQGE
jgi:putative nucleotidyltransferase with HDIG domain